MNTDDREAAASAVYVRKLIDFWLTVGELGLVGWGIGRIALGLYSLTSGDGTEALRWCFSALLPLAIGTFSFSVRLLIRDAVFGPRHSGSP